MDDKELSLVEIQQESFKVLLKLKDICEQQSLRYFLAYGTLIGATRHHGFIPWDDDIDVWMPREDYDRFLRYCIDNEESILPFKLLHFSNTKNYPYTIARLSDSRFRSDYSGVKDYGLGLFVDIYPLDYVKGDDASFRKKQIRRIMNARRLYGTDHSLKAFIRRIYVRLLLLLTLSFTKRNYLKLVDRKAQKCKRSDADCLVSSTWEYFVRPDKISWFFSEEKELMFNGVSFKVPSDYESILKNHYGNYMEFPPEQERHPYHSYKVFRK